MNRTPVIEKAVPPLAPALPNKQRTVLLAGFLGIFLGVGLVFFREYMNTTVRGAGDISQASSWPTIGFLPHIDLRRFGLRKKIKPEFATHTFPRSFYAENIRYARSSLQYARAGAPPKILLVTSALPSEGKSTVATNLAIAFAQQGLKCLLIDADLKSPSLHKFFEIDRSDGLSEILTGRVQGELNGHVLRKTEIKNLSVLTSGSRPPNPVDLLDSPFMEKLLATFAERFDQVIIDSAPVLDMADTGVLAPKVDGVLIVVKPGSTPKSAIGKIRDRMQTVGGQVLGVLLNDRKARSRTRYGYGSGSERYGYGYGGASYGSNYGEVEESLGEHLVEVPAAATLEPFVVETEDGEISIAAFAEPVEIDKEFKTKAHDA